MTCSSRNSPLSYFFLMLAERFSPFWVSDLVRDSVGVQVCNQSTQSWLARVGLLWFIKNQFIKRGLGKRKLLNFPGCWGQVEVEILSTEHHTTASLWSRICDHMTMIIPQLAALRAALQSLSRPSQWTCIRLCRAGPRAASCGMLTKDLLHYQTSPNQTHHS